MLKQKLFKISATLILFLSFIFVPFSAHGQLFVARAITFPVIGQVSYSDDFGDPRSGHTHEGNDLLGKKMMPLVAAVDGTVAYVNYPEATWGYSVGIRDKDGYQYWYLHMNNDIPGTDNGVGGGQNAYAPDMVPGGTVLKGQLIGWMGDSGNAESTSPHLHFEIHDPSGQPFDPYLSLKSADHISAPVTEYPVQGNESVPYGSFTGGAKIAIGNFDNNKSTTELVTGAGPGGGPLVRVFKQDRIALSAFYAYATNFNGGMDVATGDTDGDGVDEIITGAGAGGGPHVRIFKLEGTEVKSFYAYDTTFRGGVSVTTADVDGDGKAEIITGAGPGGGPHVRVFKADGSVVSEFFAYDTKFRGGIDVAGVSANASQTAIIITGAGPGGGPHVKVFSMAGALISQFMAYEPKFNGGVRVSAGNVNNTTPASEILTAPASLGGPHVREFNYDGTEVKGDLTGFEPWWNGSYDIAAGNGIGFISSGFTLKFLSGIPGSRRASVRQVFQVTNNFQRNRFNQ